MFVQHFGKSLKDELYEYFDFSNDTPTNSSFNQRRAQILPEAFEFLFHEFTSSVSHEKLYRGYRLLACDGSDIHISHNPNDKTTYFQNILGVNLPLCDNLKLDNNIVDEMPLFPSLGSVSMLKGQVVVKLGDN